MDNHIRKVIAWSLIGFLATLTGCQHLKHPEALYREAPRLPLEVGREYEINHKYAKAEREYLHIDNVIVKDLTLNQLTSAWKSVNANIIRAQEQVQQQPRQADVHLKLAQAYYSKGLLCTEYTRGTVGVYPRDFVFGEQEYFYSEALREAKKSIRLQPGLPEAYLLIGEIYLANFHRKEALNQLKQLIVTSPEYAQGYYAIGKVYLEMKQYEKVERYFIRSIKLAPDFIDAYYLLGQYYLDQEWFEYAAYTFLEILRRKPADTLTFEQLIVSCHQLGEFYVEQERYGTAIILFQEILKVKPSYMVYQSLSQAQKKKQDAAELEKEKASQAENTSSEEEQPQEDSSEAGT